MNSDFSTSSLDLAAYLMAVGHTVISTEKQANFITFLFDPSAAQDAANFSHGAQAPANLVLESYRKLRTIITTHERQNKYANRRTF